MPWPSVTYSFSPSTTAKSAEVNQNTTDLINAIERGCPTGKGADWYTNTAPSGWLLCDGSAVSRATYARLFAVIGTTFGAGDGSTTFNLPPKKGKVGVGRDAAQTEFDTLGETGGAKTHTLTIAEMPAHQHVGFLQWGTSDGQNRRPETGSGNYVGTGASSASVDSTGGGGAHNNLQPYLVQNYIIKD